MIFKFTQNFMKGMVEVKNGFIVDENILVKTRHGERIFLKR